MGQKMGRVGGDSGRESATIFSGREGTATTRACISPAFQPLSGQLKLVAPSGLFRVVGMDTFEFDDADYLIGDFPSLRGAKHEAVKHLDDSNLVFIYDDAGRCLWSGGKP